MTWLPFALPTGSGSSTIVALESAVVPTLLCVNVHLERLPLSKSSNFCHSAEPGVPEARMRPTHTIAFVFISFESKGAAILHAGIWSGANLAGCGELPMFGLV